MRPIIIFLLLFFFTGTVTSAATLELDIRSADPTLHQIIHAALVLPLLSPEDSRLNRQRLGSYQRQLPRLVREILEPYGYFHSSISLRLEEPAPDRYRIVIDLESGQPLRITSIDTSLGGEGASQPGLLAVLNQFPLQVGDILRQDIYEEGKARLRQEAIGLGFLDANFTRHQILAHLEELSAAIILHFDTGRRYRFGDTLFVERAGYPEKFLKRFLSYHKGDPFSYSLLGKTQVQLINADLFRSATVRGRLELAEEGFVPVEIDLLALPRHQLRPGIGYGTDTGARVSLQYRHLNLWNAAHEFVGKMQIAQWRQNIETTYIIPDRRRLDSVTLLSIGAEREDVDTYYRREVFSEAEYRRSFGRGYKGSLFVRLTSERSRIADSDQRTQFLLPGIRLGWQNIDDPLTPKRGLKAQLELIGADENFLSDTSLVQLSANVAGLLPLPQRFSVFLQLRGGTTWHKSSFSALPVSLRYFAGGDRSVRGYKYNSLGPENEDGEVVGGKHLLVASIELEKRFFERWGAAVFYDVGNAFDNIDDYELKQGAGVGLRYFTQIGAIRLDLARQVGEGNNKLRLHLSVGLGW